MLQDVFPRKLDRDEGDEILITEIYRNFAYPVQDWTPWLEAMGYSEGSPASKLVKVAQSNYEQELDKTAKEYLSKKIDKKAAENRVRTALAKFSNFSKLDQLFETFLLTEFKGVEHRL
jgi:hypothetical protein